MQNCNFSDKFVSKTGLKILILSAGMDACHRFRFSDLSHQRINYNVSYCKPRRLSQEQREAKQNRMKSINFAMNNAK